MPRVQPTISSQALRNVTEKWQWRDRKSGVMVTGYNPPADALEKTQKPYYIRYITSKGVTEQGEVITLKVNLEKMQRLVKFTASNQCRWVRDYLVIEVDGMRVITH
jgi:hypothetical protein